MPANPAKTLLSPDNHSLLMIDHQISADAHHSLPRRERDHQPCSGPRRGSSDLHTSVHCPAITSFFRSVFFTQSNDVRVFHELRVVRSIGFTALVASARAATKF
jgi:hypothetical protein